MPIIYLIMIIAILMEPLVIQVHMTALVTVMVTQVALAIP